uniref:Uncharacterized protein n=1 Tax=Timema cristinae TaxID=61476 RepID=A0A7R9HBB3_TIMCR|nr:unnamed protein product [Timema cristinae]
MEDNENPLVHVDSLKLLEVKAGAVSDEWPRLQAKDSVENMLQAKDSVEDLMYGMDHLLRYMNRTLAKLEAEEPYCAAPEDECVTERKAEESLRSGITSCPDDNPKKELDVFGSQLVKKFNQLMEDDHNWRVAANLLGCSDREGKDGII